MKISKETTQILEAAHSLALEAAKDIELLKAELRLRTSVGWQPIETAPKHEEILTLMKHGVLQGEWDGDVVRGYYWREMEWYATHWMPLPKPPEVEP